MEKGLYVSVPKKYSLKDLKKRLTLENKLDYIKNKIKRFRKRNQESLDKTNEFIINWYIKVCF